MGPLLNPVGAKRQLVGVYARGLVETLAHVLSELGCERALVVHGDDGLDEITTTTRSQAALLSHGKITAFGIAPEEFGIERASPDALAGGDARENAEIARAILAGEPGPRRDVVLLNAAAALFVAEAAPDLATGIELARDSIDSGAARGRLEALIEASAALARPN
jgi:anthranilate phosphoribosyltransferase